ncbi:MAG: lytic murein transglycosylase [Acidithiobacillus sp.]|nr:lytic murein transglycosylase [Acidithiobacillus sp.]
MFLIGKGSQTLRARCLLASLPIFLAACAQELPPVATIQSPPITPTLTTSPTPILSSQLPALPSAKQESKSLQSNTVYCPQDLQFPGFPARYQETLRHFACQLQTQYGLPARVVIPALQNAQFSARALALMTPPPPSATPRPPYPWWRYRNRFLQEDRIQKGIHFWQEHAQIMEQVSRKYGVSPYILMGILNIETGFGAFQGNFPVLDANLSLAAGLPARRNFFLYQTAETLKLAARLGVPVNTLRGSEAGAMGMSQFLASSYLQYGTVWNDPPGEGLPDLWRSVPDVLASTSRFFLAHGWQAGQPVLLPATVTSPTQAKSLLQGRYSLATLARFGVRPSNEASTLPGSMLVGLLQLQTEEGPRFYLACPNFYAIMGYNPSINYSATVWAYANALQARLG